MMSKLFLRVLQILDILWHTFQNLNLGSIYIKFAMISKFFLRVLPPYPINWGHTFQKPEYWGRSLRSSFERVNSKQFIMGQDIPRVHNQRHNVSNCKIVGSFILQ